MLEEIILKPLDIVVTRDRTPISWWLRVASGSEWSHTCLIGEVSDDDTITTGLKPDQQSRTIYTTTATGYRHVSLDDYLKGKSFQIWRYYDLSLSAIPINLSKEQTKIGLTVNHQELGKPYAYSDVVMMMLQNLKGHGVKKLDQDSKNHFCAEMVAYTYAKMGVILAPQLQKDFSGYTPCQVVDDHRLKLIAEFAR